jgi:hypothetical protein
MTIHHFNYNGKNRPTLCAYCKAPAGPLLYKDGDYWLGACSMNHLKKIGEGKRLPNKAQLNDEGVEYSIAQTKNVYVELAREERNQPLHKWDRDNRKRVFTSIVREYLNWANAVAQQDDERAKHGSDEILSRRK